MGAAPSYAGRADVFGAGVPRGALVRPAREIASVDAVANVLELEGHGLSLNDGVVFTVGGGGALPSGLALLTVYYALLIALADGSTDENRFQVAATPNGAPVALGSTGAAPFSLAVPVGPMIDAYSEQFSRWADASLINHVVPLTAPYPSWVVMVVKLRTAVAVMNDLGRSSPKLEAREASAIADFLRMAKAPLRDARATSPANLAIARNAAHDARYHRGHLP